MTNIFVAGAAGFIGNEFVKESLAANYKVYGLTRSEESANRLQRMGAVPVIGDLSQPEGWHEVVAECEMVVHLAQPDTYGARITVERALSYREKRLRMDQNLMAAIDRQRIQRVVFVLGTSYYGHLGMEIQTEDTMPNPKGWGPYIAPAIEAVPGYVASGLPIVQAFPGWVYGPGSWYAEYQLTPLSKGRPVMRLGGRPQMVSPVHVSDCARGILYLLTQGEVGKRYFIVDDLPVPSTQLVYTTAQAMGVPARIIPLPKFICQLAVGNLITESMGCDFRLSNQHIKALGFKFSFPNIDAGIPDVVQRWMAAQSPLVKVTA